MEFDSLVETIIKRVIEKINDLNKKRFLILSSNNQSMLDVLECISSKFIANVSDNYEEIKNHDYVVIESNELLKILKNKQVKCIEEDITSKKELNDIFKIEKRIITEKDLQPLIRLNVRRIHVLERAILTPLALDFIRENKIELVRKR
ncbi:hypothetical protein ABG79_01702 [Caloramator mitchellensis]|uniref:Ethanolamine utilization protein n=1 Tax=Caloramator mitchellensis TaxID=908809 RepID=A0A0R3JSL6_CALMK|nr:hypothetical protein [Caloramator mitchellensis]KRQ86496.1 hypothetical protein ABG79_01702 [Caloramator mitchellensis]